MPVAQITAPNAPFGEPTVANDGLNDQVLVAVVNNTGTILQQGTVVVWDTNTALATAASLLVNVAQQGTRASYTLTATTSTAGFPATGSLLLTPAAGAPPLGITMGATTVLAGPFAATNVGQYYVGYTGIAGSTFTGCRSMYTTTATGIPANAVINGWPGSVNGPNLTASSIGGPVPNPPVPQVGLPTGTTDAGRVVTLSPPGGPAANPPLLAGVISPTGDSATNGKLVQPGQATWACISGVARVNIGASTVAAAALLTGDVIVGQAIGGGTLGNLLGIALESQAAIDVNNCIRAAIKVG